MLFNKNNKRNQKGIPDSTEKFEFAENKSVDSKRRNTILLYWKDKKLYRNTTRFVTIKDLHDRMYNKTWRNQKLSLITLLQWVVLIELINTLLVTVL